MIQVFIPDGQDNHRREGYMYPVPNEEILAWLANHGLNYWAMGFPVFVRPKCYEGFQGSVFNFRDHKIAMLFKLTWGGR